MSKKIKPKCFTVQKLATNAKGYLIPCCWCGPASDEDTNFKKLIKDKFHLEKINNINEILYSEEWQEFKNDLIESNVNKLPNICIKKCSVNNNERDNINQIRIFVNKDEKDIKVVI
jgi:hypothetical protein